MRIFHKKDGGIVQVIDKERMLQWPIELPLIFIEYFRKNKLNSYNDTKVQKEISVYLDEILKDVAIPRLIQVLEGNDREEIIMALTRMEELSKKNSEMAKPIQPYIENLLKINNKTIVSLAKKISNNFTRAERRKELVKKRKFMQEKEKQFLAGKLNAAEYAKARKEYLLLKE